MRELLTARLIRKQLLSEAAQCFHLEFAAEQSLAALPGQFISCVAEDGRGKQQTRAYSLASISQAQEFALCVNRVEGGFFSNLLCDLEPGQTIAFHGPHGTFSPHEPLSDSLWIASDTGVAPFRSFAEWFFTEGQNRIGDFEISLVYEATTRDSLLYHDEFTALADKHAGFRYYPVVSSEAASAEETPNALQQTVSHIVQGRKARQAETGAAGLSAYICGLNAMVAPMRAHLVSLGWERRQIEFERYD